MGAESCRFVIRGAVQCDSYELSVDRVLLCRSMSSHEVDREAPSTNPGVPTARSGSGYGLWPILWQVSGAYRECLGDLLMGKATESIYDAPRRNMDAFMKTACEFLLFGLHVILTRKVQDEC